MKRVITAADGLSSRDRIKIAKTTTNPRELQRLAYDKSAKVRQAVANNKNTSDNVLAMLADDEDVDVRCAVAVHVKDSEVLAKLADDKVDRVKIAIGYNKNAPSYIFDKFADDESASVRNTAAIHTENNEVLKKLAQDDNEIIRSNAAQEVNDAKIHLSLAKDVQANVRSSLAENASISDKVAMMLANDSDSSVRRSLARHTHCLTALNRLADDSDQWVVECVMDNELVSPELLVKIANNPASEQIRNAAVNRISDSEFLAQLAQSPYYVIRSEVAERISDDTVLAQLAHDENSNVRLSVAKNRQTPPEVLQELAHDEDDDVIQRFVASNPSTPDSVLMELAQIQDPFLLNAIARNKSASAEVLKEVIRNLPEGGRMNHYIIEDVNKRLSAKSAKKRSYSKKPTQTEWSIPIYELNNYSDIEREIDQVISDAVEVAIAQAYPGEEYSFETTANSYDEAGNLIINVAGKTLTYDLQTILPMATFSQKKKDCIKKLADYLVKNI